MWKSGQIRTTADGPLSHMEIDTGRVCIIMEFDGLNQSVRLHSHAFDHWMECLKGSAIITIDDVSKIVSEGDRYMVEAHKRHGVQCLIPGTILKCTHENEDIKDVSEEGIPAEWIFRLTDSTARASAQA